MTRTSEQQRTYYERNKERIKARALAHYRTHREHKIAYAAEYQKKHKDEKRRNNEKYRKKVRRLLLEFLGNKCVVCGTLEHIELDHINAGGSKDRILKHNNWDMYRYYLKHPDEAKEKLQLLCKHHNLRKEITKDENYMMIKGRIKQ